ncbi:MAG: hypothetical protein J5565_01665 [Muribaculaceae bacterium]|nr:hypothetical protein [Muribaculaceae bacterium]
MYNADFWALVNAIIDEGFTPEGLQKLDSYAEQFINGKLVYQRFSPIEQHGCSTGGATHVIASLLAAAKTGTNSPTQSHFSDFKAELENAKQQAECIESWARATGCWIDNVNKSLSIDLGEQIAEGGEAVVFDHGPSLIKSIGLDYYILPLLALDRVTLHNAYFPETRLIVLGFGRDDKGDFKIIVEQPFIKGRHISDEEIAHFLGMMGFELKNPGNWTYATPKIYLSDVHDENVIMSDGGNVFVIDCDIRLNTPDLKQGGIRQISNEMLDLDGLDTDNLKSNEPTAKEPIAEYGLRGVKQSLIELILSTDDMSVLRQVKDYLATLTKK